MSTEQGRIAKAATWAEFWVDQFCQSHHHQQQLDEGWDDFETLRTEPSSSDGGDGDTIVDSADVRKSSSWVNCRSKLTKNRSGSGPHPPHLDCRDDEVSSIKSRSSSASTVRRGQKILSELRDAPLIPVADPRPPRLVRIPEYPYRLSSYEIKEHLFDYRFREAALRRVLVEIKALGAKKKRDERLRALQEELETIERELANNPTMLTEASTEEDRLSLSSPEETSYQRGEMAEPEAKNSSRQLIIQTSFSSHRVSDVSDSDDPAVCRQSRECNSKSPAKQVRSMRIRRNTDSNNQLKPCISFKRTPAATVVVDDEAAFFTDVTHSTSHDSDFPSYDDDDSTGDHLVMLSTVQMIKESQSMVSIMEQPMTKDDNNIVPEENSDNAQNSVAANIEIVLTEIYLAQLKADFHLSRTRMQHVLAELRQLHQRRDRKERPRRRSNSWKRVLVLTLTLVLILRLASHLVPALSALFYFDRPYNLFRARRIPSGSSRQKTSAAPSPPRTGMDFNLRRFIEYHRPA